MGAPSLSWIDQAELDQALSRAGVETLASSARKLSERGYWPEVGVAKAPAAVAPPPSPGTAAVAIAEPNKKAVEAYVPPEGQLGERLEHYLRWVIEQTGCRQIFVADADGLVLMESYADPDLVAISSMFVSVLNRVDASLSSPIKGSVAIDLEVGDSLHVVQAETGLGPYALGFAVPRPASREMVERARDGLVRVMSGLEDAESEAEQESASSGGVPRTSEMNRQAVRRRNEPM